MNISISYVSPLFWDYRGSSRNNSSSTILPSGLKYLRGPWRDKAISTTPTKRVQRSENWEDWSETPLTRSLKTRLWTALCYSTRYLYFYIFYILTYFTYIFTYFTYFLFSPPLSITLGVPSFSLMSRNHFASHYLNLTLYFRLAS